MKEIRSILKRNKIEIKSSPFEELERIAGVVA